MPAKKKTTKQTPVFINESAEILHKAAVHIENRAALRDQPDGEKSFKRTAELCNVMLQDKLHADLTGEDIALILMQLKVVRSQNGDLVVDDYEDMAAYAALAYKERLDQE